MAVTLQTHRPQLWRNFDLVLLALVTILTVIGIAAIRSATFESPTLADLPSSQIRWALIGLGVVFVTTAIDYRYWRSFIMPFYVLVMFLLLAVDAIGVNNFGSVRTLKLGPLNIQPSELAKIGSILWTAYFVSNNRERIKDFKWVLISLTFSGVPAGLVLAEPNLGTAIMIIVVWFAVIFAAGIRWKHIGIFVGAGIIGAPASWFIMQDYQRQRIIRFVNPSADPSSQYNIKQALISIGSGGIFGQGYNHASQINLRFLKVRHTDFIFASLSSEFGFIGSLVIVLLVSLIIFRILWIGQHTRDPFGALICYGVAAMLFYQSFFNMGMNMNILPVGGLPLPFVSYGGSALVAFLFAIGLVESVALRSKEQSSFG